MATKPRIDVRLRLDFGPSSALGPGKIALLEEIALGGSLSHAALELGMSYRRAWALLQDLGRAFGEPVAITSVGGRAGGGAQLTPFAHRLIAAYRAVESKAASAAAEEFAGVVRPRARPRRATLRRTVKKTRRGGRPAASRS
jgi:molybdate transport system regulatory protein